MDIRETIAGAQLHVRKSEIVKTYIKNTGVAIRRNCCRGARGSDDGCEGERATHAGAVRWSTKQTLRRFICIQPRKPRGTDRLNVMPLLSNPKYAIYGEATGRRIHHYMASHCVVYALGERHSVLHSTLR